MKSYKISDNVEISLENEYNPKIFQIGQGTYGKVYKGYYQTKEGETKIVAIKKLPIKENEGLPISGTKELMIMSQFKHPNLVSLIDSFINKTDSKETSGMFLILEYMDHDLNSLILNKVSFSLPQIRSIMHQILEGCSYLHQNSIIHRDLKSDNIFLKNDGTVKIGDFGLSRKISKFIKKEYTTNVVSIWYRAPELLFNNGKEKCYYDSKIDMWAIGCIFAELLCGEPPFRGKNEICQVFEILKYFPNFDQVYPLVVSQEYTEKIKQHFEKQTLREKIQNKMNIELDNTIWDLLNKMLEIDPFKRISPEEALKHEFFKNYEELPANLYLGECHRVILKPTKIDDVLENIQKKNENERLDMVLPELHKFISDQFYNKNCQKGIILSMENDLIKGKKNKEKIIFPLYTASEYIKKSLNDDLLIEFDDLKNIFN